MKKEKKKKPTPDQAQAPVVELDETAAPKGLSLQEMADALGEQMEQEKESGSEPSKPAPARPRPVLTDEASTKKTAELEETVKQLVAENRNQKTRLENDFRTKLKFSMECFFREFVVVKDDLEKALTFAPADGDQKTAAFIDGVRHLNTNIDALLRRYGVESFGAVGESFDPNLHQAMRMVDTAEKPANEITAQYLKGWRYNDRVLRPAMVEVASGNAPAEEKPSNEHTEATTEITDKEESHG